MDRYRTHLGLLVIPAAVLLVASTARSAPIAMPTGSTVWMHYEASACPDADGDDCIGSNLPGPNPPNGIPLTTFDTPSTGSSTGFAEIFPAQVRTFVRGRFSSFMRASFQDTYTVHGAAPGPFPIGITVSASGTVATFPYSATDHRHSSATVELEIGTFSPTDVAMNEQFRITPFDATTRGSTQLPFRLSTTPVTEPISASASYARASNVGDVFSVGYGINSTLGAGEIDLRASGAQITMTLPPGVWVTSSLGGVWGTPATPAPVGAWVRWGTALGLVALASRFLRAGRGSGA